MTYRGELMPLDRHGINRKDDCGVISKASFEEIMNIFVKAAVFGEVDNMKGVSANILAGQVCKSGTNSFDVLLAMDEIMNIDTVNKSSQSTINIDMADLDNLDDVLINEFKKNVIIKTNMFEFGLNMIEHNQTSLNKFDIEKVTINLTSNQNKKIETLEYSDTEDEDDEDENNVFGNNFESSSDESIDEDEEEEDEESEDIDISDSDDEDDKEDDEDKEDDKEDEKDKEDEDDEDDEESEDIDISDSDDEDK